MDYISRVFQRQISGSFMFPGTQLFLRSKAQKSRHWMMKFMENRWIAANNTEFQIAADVSLTSTLKVEAFDFCLGFTQVINNWLKKKTKKKHFGYLHNLSFPVFSA